MKISFLIIGLLSCGVSFATETDNFTFRDISLRDASGAINRRLNQHLLLAVREANAELKSDDKKSDRNYILKFYERWGLRTLSNTALFLEMKPSQIIVSEYEGCIISNTCPGWEKVERIIFNPGESIYDAVRYNLITAHLAVPVVNLCGVHVGVDKFSHFSMDGFRLFGKWLFGASLREVAQSSMGSERGLNGLALTEVMSLADHNTNMDAIRFYQNLLLGKNSAVYVNRAGTLAIRHAVDICSVVSARWNESTREGRIFLAGDRRAELIQVIRSRIANPNPWRRTKQEIVNRKIQQVSLVSLSEFSGVFAGTLLHEAFDIFNPYSTRGLDRGYSTLYMPSVDADEIPEVIVRRLSKE